MRCGRRLRWPPAPRELDFQVLTSLSNPSAEGQIPPPSARRRRQSGGPSWLKTGRDPGNSERGTGRASDSQFRPSFYKRGNPDQGGRCRTKRHAHQRKSLDKGPGGLTGHPFGCRLDHLPLRTPPASLLQSPALPCPEFVTRRARGVARLPEVHRRPLLAGAEGRDPEPLLSPPRRGHTSSGSQHSGSLYHFKEISITRRCFYIDLHFSWGGWDS